MMFHKKPRFLIVFLKEFRETLRDKRSLGLLALFTLMYPVMLGYILKRILLMLPTLLGALTITFIVVQFVPGGPIETIMAEASAGGDGEAYRASRDIDKKQIEELK